MRAARLLGPGNLQIAEMAEPECPQEGLLVRVRACGICSADSKMVAKGHPALTYPRVPGHEISGQVVQSTCIEFAEGDRVQVAPGLRCGKCSFCLRGADNQCKQRQIHGFTLDGGFAEYLAVPLSGELKAGITRLSDDLPYDLATLAEPLACCLNAFSKMAVHRDDTVLIVGAGTLGLLNGLVAKHRGAKSLIFSDPRKERRQMALEFGASRAVEPQKEDLAQVINEESNGLGVDVLILASSQVGLNEEILQMMSRGGRISLFSGLPPECALPGFDLNLIHYKELEVSGAYGCTAAQNAEAIELITKKKEVLQTLITEKVDFKHLQKALEQREAKDKLKAVLEV